MEITTGFLIYGTLFRLAIITVGMVSILLGYLLFIKDPVGQGKTTATLTKGGFNISLKNFWPGVYFALFGTVIIGLMLWQGNPQLVFEELKTINDASTIGKNEIESHRTITMRGDCNNIEECWKFLSNPQQTLYQAAQHIIKISDLWYKEKRIKEALALALLTVKIEPRNSTYLAKLARLFLANNEPAKSLKAMEAAAELDDQYEQELANLKSSTH
jgi:hypothetical protein